jgi:hypothetical protein
MSFKVIEFSKIVEPRGNLTFLEYSNQIPFKMDRVFWTYDLPGVEKRGGHVIILSAAKIGTGSIIGA